MSQKTVQKETEANSAEMGEFSVTDELYEISEATNKDGTVDVKIHDFEKLDDDKVTVLFYTPTMDVRSETMKWPRKDSKEYKFVRICRATVGGLSGAEWFKTDGATIKADPDDWEIKAELSTATEIKQGALNTSMVDIAKYTGFSLFAIWVAALSTILIGVPIIGATTMLGITGAVAGLIELWGMSLAAMIGTLILMPK